MGRDKVGKQAMEGLQVLIVIPETNTPGCGSTACKRNTIQKTPSKGKAEELLRRGEREEGGERGLRRSWAFR